MQHKADIAVYDADGQLTLVVETKSKLGTSSVWAAKMRRNILAHGLLPKTRFFLLALPDRFYLWKDVSITPEIVRPTYEIDSTPFLQAYYDKSTISPENLSGESFELIVVSWLSEILRADMFPSTHQQNQAWIIKSGLFKAIRKGRLASAMPV